MRMIDMGIRRLYKMEKLSNVVLTIVIVLFLFLTCICFNVGAYTLTEKDKILTKKFEVEVFSMNHINSVVNVGDGIMLVVIANSYYKLNSYQQQQFIKKLHKIWVRVEGSGLPTFINIMNYNGKWLLSYPSPW